MDSSDEEMLILLALAEDEDCRCRALKAAQLAEGSATESGSSESEYDQSWKNASVSATQTSSQHESRDNENLSTPGTSESELENKNFAQCGVAGINQENQAGSFEYIETPSISSTEGMLWVKEERPPTPELHSIDDYDEFAEPSSCQNVQNPSAYEFESTFSKPTVSNQPLPSTSLDILPKKTHSGLQIGNLQTSSSSSDVPSAQRAFVPSFTSRPKKSRSYTITSVTPVQQTDPVSTVTPGHLDASCSKTESSARQAAMLLPPPSTAVSAGQDGGVSVEESRISKPSRMQSASKSTSLVHGPSPRQEEDKDEGQDQVSDVTVVHFGNDIPVVESERNIELVLSRLRAEKLLLEIDKLKLERQKLEAEKRNIEARVSVLNLHKRLVSEEHGNTSLKYNMNLVSRISSPISSQPSSDIPTGTKTSAGHEDASAESSSTTEAEARMESSPAVTPKKQEFHRVQSADVSISKDAPSALVCGEKKKKVPDKQVTRVENPVTDIGDEGQLEIQEEARCDLKFKSGLRNISDKGIDPSEERRLESRSARSDYVPSTSFHEFVKPPDKSVSAPGYRVSSEKSVRSSGVPGCSSDSVSSERFKMDVRDDVPDSYTSYETADRWGGSANQTMKRLHEDSSSCENETDASKRSRPEYPQ